MRTLNNASYSPFDKEIEIAKNSLYKIYKNLILSKIPKKILRLLKQHLEILGTCNIYRVDFIGFTENEFLFYLPEYIEVPEKFSKYPYTVINREDLKDEILISKIESCIKIINRNSFDKLEELLDEDPNKFYNNISVPYLENWQDTEIIRRDSREQKAKKLLIDLKEKVDSALKRIN